MFLASSSKTMERRGIGCKCKPCASSRSRVMDTNGDAGVTRTPRGNLCAPPGWRVLCPHTCSHSGRCGPSVAVLGNPVGATDPAPLRARRCKFARSAPTQIERLGAVQYCTAASTAAPRSQLRPRDGRASSRMDTSLTVYGGWRWLLVLVGGGASVDSGLGARRACDPRDRLVVDATRVRL